MYRWIVAMVVTPTPHVKPTATATPVHPAPLSSTPGLWSLIFGVGPASVLLIIMMLALLGVIAWVIWMFRTRRWISARSLEANVEREHNGPNRSQVMTEMSAARSVYPPPPVSRLPREQMREDYSPQQSVLPVALSGENIATSQTSILQKPEDPLKNKRWLDMAEECAELFDELDGLFPRSDPRQEVATHVKYRLEEILTRSGVESISHDHAYDIGRHKLMPPNPVVAPGTPIARIISPGFAVGRRVLRPARVQVVSTSIESTGREREDE